MRTAAWTVPVMASTVAAPAYAASCDARGTGNQAILLGAFTFTALGC